MTAIKYDLPPGTLLKGEHHSYEITKTLGHGSFGITYKATARLKGNLGELPTKTTVAIKEFFMENFSMRDAGLTVSAAAGPELHVYYMKKFEEEAYKLSELKDYPGIVKVMELFSQLGTCYFVMEYLEGGTLDNRISGDQPLTYGQVLDYMEGIAKALQYIHGKDMLHLDLKPSNIMLDENNRPVLIDFGLSKHFEADGKPETGTSIGLGTTGYAPLEQVYYQESAGFQPTIDVYATGATLFKMLTGHTPPNASELLNNRDQLKKTLDGCHIPEPFSDLVIHAMQPEMKDRTADMKKLLEELETVRSILGEVIDLPVRSVTQRDDVDPEDEETDLPEGGNKLPQSGQYVTDGGDNSEKPEQTDKPESVGDGKGEGVCDTVGTGDAEDESDIKDEEAANIGCNEGIEGNNTGGNPVTSNSGSEEDSGEADPVKPDTVAPRLMKYKYYLLPGVAMMVAGIFYLMLPPQTPDEKFGQAEVYYQAGEYGQAVKLFTELAQNGHVASQWYLGKCNETGQGVESNASDAFKWYKSAAIGGYEKAYYDMALCYEKGVGTDVDEDSAMIWYAKSADENAKRALERMDCHPVIKEKDMEVLLTSDNRDSCRIMAVIVDYENMGNHFQVSYPLDDPQSVRIVPKGNCDIHFAYQHKNRAVKRDSVSFNFNAKLEQMILERNEEFVGKFFPESREIIVWLAENEGYNEVPTLDKLNRFLKNGYLIYGFTPMKNAGQNLDNVMDYRNDHYNPIMELHLRKK